MNPIQNSLTGPVSGSIQRSDPVAPRGGGVATPRTAGGDVQTGGDTVSISNSARLLNTAAAESTAGASPAQIAQLKSAIEGGRYTVSPQTIAQGLLRDSRALQQASGQQR